FAVVQVLASVEVRIRPPSPTATKVPSPCATAVNRPGAPESAGVQVAPSVEVRIVAVSEKRSMSPTATKLPSPNATPSNHASVPETMVVQFDPSEVRIRPLLPTATNVPLP